MLQRASPKDLRNALELVHNLKMQGIDFVPIPVTSQEHKQELFKMFENSLQELEKIAGEK